MIIKILGYLYKFSLWIVFMAMNVIYTPINYLRSFKKYPRCEPITDPLLLFSATQLAHKIRKREITSERIVRCYINRIISVNTVLNAVVEDRFNLALAEAKEVDNYILNCGLSEEEISENKPLLGVPITVKESIAVKGCTNNAGSVQATYLRARAKEDAEPVRLVKEAGAIILAVTNTPEFCINWETTNKVTGTTRNPYNTNKTPGGSTGGEAALISSAASVIGLGTDMAGSLRLPAHFTGIWSHKGTADVVSQVGHFPSSPDPRLKMLNVVGPITRYAIDLPLLMKVIVKPDARELLKLDEEVDMHNLKLFYMFEAGVSISHKVDKDIKSAMKNAIMYMGNNFGITCTKVEMKLFTKSLKLTLNALMDVTDLDCRFDDKGREYEELFKYFTCRSNRTSSSLLYFLGQRFFIGTSLQKRLYKETVDELQSLRDDFDSMLGDDGVFFYPIHPKTAFNHHQVHLRATDSHYCSMFNALGLPATAVPLGFHSDGMPIAIQVVANKNNDRLCLAVAKELEQGFGGWQPPLSTKESPMIFDN